MGIESGSFEQSLDNIDRDHHAGNKVARCDRDAVGWAANISRFYGPGMVELGQLEEGRLFERIDNTQPVYVNCPEMNQTTVYRLQQQRGEKF
ncbi:MAG TPA: hypothetical protein VHE53_02935 [Patescibacteria group bacterium]|nr:hypothetical protein [Patescibacteria group bacterium]